MRVRITRDGLLCLLGWCALGVSPLAAQDQSDRQDTAGAAPTSSRIRPDEATGVRDARRADPGRKPGQTDLRTDAEHPFTRYFFDDFSSAALDRRKWEVGVGVTPTRDLADQAPSVAAIRLSTGKRGVDRQPELRSVPIGLAGIRGAELSYTVRQRGVEAGERLVVEYLSADGRWQTIERVVAAGRDSVGFSRHIRVLPEHAMHAAFRIRFRPNVDDADDAWYLGEVSVTTYEPMYTLTVHVWPARNARVEVVAADRSERLDGVTPFARSWQADTRVHLVAPPMVDERVFSHWSVDGALQPDGERVLTLEMRRGTEAVAHYRPWVPGRSEALVAVVSMPDPGVPIALGPEPGRLYTEVVAGAEYRCLTGEWLTLLAPPRSARRVFAGWVVNGQARPRGENPLDHRVEGDDVLVAEYVLLGDMNGDGELDKFDVDEFVLALIDPRGYAERHPDLNRTRRGDINDDGVFDARDVEGFVDLMLSD